jgi:predicted metal-dependent enzyme (double-stranded beta helix superfamily)
MWSAIDELSWASMGYTPSERNNLMHCITRMASILNKQPKNKRVKEELKMLLQKYEEKYAWLDEI